MRTIQIQANPSTIYRLTATQGYPNRPGRHPNDATTKSDAVQWVNEDVHDEIRQRSCN
jgi:hypothetical protein